MKCYSLIAGLEYATPVPRLKLTLSDGRKALLSYHRVTYAEWSEDGHHLLLEVGHRMFEGKGEQLDRLMELFQTECLRHLHCMNPAVHIADEDTPILYELIER